MKFTPRKIIHLILFFYLLFVSLSCSKDSDLLADAALLDPDYSVDEYGGTEEGEGADEFVTRTVTFSAVADAYIEGANSYDGNVMRLQENVRTSYILFDLSAIVGDITDVTLRFTIDADQGNGNISVFKGLSNNWNEENLTESNAPAIDIELGAINKSYNQGVTEFVELSSADIQAEKITIILTHSAGDDLAIASKENPSQNGPELVVTYNAPADSTEITQEQEPDPEDEFIVESPDYGPLKAFPSAHGAGTHTTGGRGFPVVQVTNLNDSGPGSLREALSAGNRTIVFAVSGIIQLTSPLIVTGNNITIAGQTAPAGGIAITGTNSANRLTWRADNAIIRYVRFRPVFDTNAIYDGVDFEGGLENIIVDHCSFAWGGDETISFFGNLGNQPDNITFSRNIIYKGWKGSIFGYGNWYDDGEIERPTGDFSYNQNLVAHTSHRMPGFGTDDRMDVINNVIHNWYERLLVANRVTNFELNYQGNYLQGGCFNIDPTTNQFKFNVIDYDPSQGTPLIHASGNYYDKYPSVDQEELWRYWNDAKAPKVVGDRVDDEFFTGSAFSQLGDSFTVLSAAAAKTDLTTGGAGAVWRLDSGGNKIVDKDVLDTAAINDVINNICVSYTYNGADWQNSAEYNNYRSTITGTPINTHPASYDTDADGMPDSWEIGMWGDLSKTATGDENGNGYTNLEEFINLVDL